jgi:hypothetical protein
MKEISKSFENIETPHSKSFDRNSMPQKDNEIYLDEIQILKGENKSPNLEDNNLEMHSKTPRNNSQENIKYINRSLTVFRDDHKTSNVPNGPKFSLDTLPTKQILNKRRTIAGIKTTYSEKTQSVFQSPASSSVKEESQILQINDNEKDKKVEYCDICFQDIKAKFTLSCGDFFCKECIRQHLLTCLSNAIAFRNVRCPKTICNEKIKEVFYEKLLTPSEFEKYSKIKQRIDGLYNPLNFPCPIPDCDSYGERAEIKNSNLECLKKHKFCVKCLKQSHRGKNCPIDTDETEKILDNDRLIKKCPNCQSWVEKMQPTGCNNVTCGNIWCSLTFCWICMNPFEKNHYNNPLSICFGMQEVKNDSHFAKHKCLRVFKCMIIFLILVFILLPIVILLFSMVVITFYILAFVLDGSAVKNLKLKTEKLQKIFRFLIYSTYIVISLPSLSLGYWTLAILIISSPFLYIYKKCCSQKDEDESNPEYN